MLREFSQKRVSFAKDYTATYRISKQVYLAEPVKGFRVLSLLF